MGATEGMTSFKLLLCLVPFLLVGKVIMACLESSKEDANEAREKELHEPKLREAKARATKSESEATEEMLKLKLEEQQLRNKKLQLEIQKLQSKLSDDE